jgi:hypothetical protein
LIHASLLIFMSGPTDARAGADMALRWFSENSQIPSWANEGGRLALASYDNE